MKLLSVLFLAVLATSCAAAPEPKPVVLTAEQKAIREGLDQIIIDNVWTFKPTQKVTVTQPNGEVETYYVSKKKFVWPKLPDYKF